MRLKIILCILSLTIVGCFYSQSQKLIELENQIKIQKETYDKTLHDLIIFFDNLIKETHKEDRFIT